jgi:solute carrier family 25 carnitine/acylcarnitine transporter 20/29
MPQTPPQQPHTPQQPPPALNEAIAGAAAGVAGCVLGFPLDTIKARLQTSHGSGGVASIVRSIAAADGARGFYRGIASPMLSMTVLNTLSFRSWAAARELCGLPHAGSPSDTAAPPGSAAQRFVAGALVAPGVTLLSTPFELVKVQLQLDKAKRFQGAWHAGQQIYQQAGLRALWLGGNINLVREGLFLGVYFWLYEQARYELVHAGVAPGFAVPVAGGLSGAAAWVVSFPLDSIKNNVQGQKLELLATPQRLRTTAVATAVRALQALHRAPACGPGPHALHADDNAPRSPCLAAAVA